MKVAAYTRVACANQFALDHQLNSIQKYANAYGHNIVTVISDNGISGLNNDVGLETIIHLAEEGRISAVICCDPSRITRDFKRMYDFLTTLRSLEIAVIFLPPYEQCGLEHIHTML